MYQALPCLAILKYYLTARHVFSSEGRLYGEDKNVNHRIRPISQAVYEHLFERHGSEECALYPVVVAGATAIEQKLCSYGNFLGGYIRTPSHQ